MMSLRIDSGADDVGGGRVMMVTVVWRFDKLGSSRKRHGFADKTYIRSNGFVGRTRSGTAEAGIIFTRLPLSCIGFLCHVLSSCGLKAHVMFLSCFPEEVRLFF